MSQVRERRAPGAYAKETGTAVFLVGHVTKEGGIAGPRVLEHMVDAVLYFEGDAGSRFRVLRVQNRFGAVNELGVFAMGDKGLREVPNPSAIFLSAAPRRNRELRDGHARGHASVAGGSAGAGGFAVVESAPGRGRRGAEPMAMLLAVLHRHGGIGVADQDVFVMSSAASAWKPRRTCRCCSRGAVVVARRAAGGEDGGVRHRPEREIRPVPNGEKRLKEAATHGFRRAIVPKANAPKSFGGAFKGMDR